MSANQTKATQKLFMSSSKFAVIGASKDPSKYGTKASKVLKWYQLRNFHVTPVHPASEPNFSGFLVQKEKELEGMRTVTSVLNLPAPFETSVSIITPPKVTLGILEEAKNASIPAIWLQPGAEDEDVIAWIHENRFEDRVIFGGPCILIEGDGIIKGLTTSTRSKY